jgi:hypothetical protein
MRPRQVNITLDAPDAEVLSALAFLAGVSAAEVVRPVVVAFLRGKRDDPAVTEALGVRERHRQS